MDAMGVALIEMLNKNFGTTLVVDDTTAEKIAKMVDEVVTSFDYGHCPDCDERAGEPMRDESRD